jgi:hypothetical protein
MEDRQLTIGQVPGRKGHYLGLTENGRWIPLAKFTSEAKAKVFLRLMRELQVKQIPDE